MAKGVIYIVYNCLLYCLLFIVVACYKHYSSTDIYYYLYVIYFSALPMMGNESPKLVELIKYC